MFDFPTSRGASPSKSWISKTNEKSYRADIDGLRALAIIAVVCYHVDADSLQGGFAGVDVFFVISGYLITGLILHALERGTFRFRDFYARRVKRIFPALATALTTVWILGWLVLLPDEYETLGKHIAAGAGFALNLALYSDTAWYFGPTPSSLVHLWSLGIEEQFYILWPLFIVATWNWRRLQPVLITLIILLSFLANVANISSNPIGSFYLPSSRLWELAMGGLLASWEFNGRHFLPTRLTNLIPPLSTQVAACVRHILAALGASLLALSFGCLRGGRDFPGWWALLPTTGTLMIISSGSGSWINKWVLGSRPLVYIGLISYPLYLWHWPLLYFSRTVAWPQLTPTLAILIAVAIAAISYKYVETPVRATRHAAAAVAVLSFSMAVCLLIGHETSVGSIPSRALSAQVAPFWAAATEKVAPYGDRLMTLGNGPKVVLFIGDSNVQQYYPRVAELVANHPKTSHAAVFAARGGCAPSAFTLLEGAPEIDPAGCAAFLSEALKAASQPNVDTVVIGGCWYIYFASLTSIPGTSAPPGLKSDTDRALADLKRTIVALIQQGKRVYLILQIPIGTMFDPRQMIRRTVLAPGFELGVEVPTKSSLLQWIGPVDRALREMAQSVGARVIDPMDYLCHSMCPAVSPEGTPMYRDRFHLLRSYVRYHVHFLDDLVLDSGVEATGVAAKRLR